MVSQGTSPPKIENSSHTNFGREASRRMVVQSRDQLIHKMQQQSLEEIQEMSDAPTLIFMFILAIVFAITMCFEEMAKNRY